MNAFNFNGQYTSSSASPFDAYDPYSLLGSNHFLETRNSQYGGTGYYPESTGLKHSPSYVYIKEGENNVILDFETLLQVGIFGLAALFAAIYFIVTTGGMVGRRRRRRRRRSFDEIVSLSTSYDLFRGLEEFESKIEKLATNGKEGLSVGQNAWMNIFDQRFGSKYEESLANKIGKIIVNEINDVKARLNFSLPFTIQKLGKYYWLPQLVNEKGYLENFEVSNETENSVATIDDENSNFYKNCNEKYFECVITTLTQFWKQANNLESSTRWMEKRLSHLFFNRKFGNLWKALISLPEVMQIMQCYNKRIKCAAATSAATAAATTAATTAATGAISLNEANEVIQDPIKNSDGVQRIIDLVN